MRLIIFLCGDVLCALPLILTFPKSEGATMFVDDHHITIRDLSPPACVEYLSYDDADAEMAGSIVLSLSRGWRESAKKGTTFTVESLLGEDAGQWNVHLNKIYNKCLTHHNDNEGGDLRGFALLDALQFADYWLFHALNDDTLFSFSLTISEGEYHYTYVDDTPGINPPYRISP